MSRGVERAEGDERRLGVQLLPRRRAQAEARDDLVRPARRALEHRARLPSRRAACRAARRRRSTTVSTPSTGRSPPSTERALPAACSSGDRRRAPRRSRARRPRTGSPSCSRIARRCGDVEARTSARPVTRASRATQISSHGHLLRPLGGHVGVVVVRLGVRGRLDLDQPLDLEAVRAQQVDPLAVREVELDAALGPLEAGACRTAAAAASRRPCRRRSSRG